MSILDVVGEVAEYGEFSVVPESHYPVRLTIDGIDTTDSGAGFASLSGAITEGPFTSESVSARYWLSFGKATSKGGGIPLLAYACRTVTGKPADEAVLEEYGFVAPEAYQGEDPKEYGKRMRIALRDFALELEPAERLDMIRRFVRLTEWEGKTVIASVALEPSSRKNEKGEPSAYFNGWKAFYPISDPKKGIEYCRSVSFPEQEAALAAGV